MYEPEQMNLQRWIRNDRRKEIDNTPKFPDYLWYQDWTRLPPLSEVLELELGEQ